LEQIKNTEKNYTISVNDYLKVDVFTNGGEKIIDPNSDFQENSKEKNTGDDNSPRFLVRENGRVQLPMIGNIQLAGFTLFEADSILAKKYNVFYKDVFVITKVLNKRVLVFGPLGGKVIPLENEDMNLIEVIALYGGITKEGKADNIRLIRGEPDNPSVQVIDLSTIEGMKKASLAVKAHDIIYIEPEKGILTESVKTILPIIGVVGNILTIVFLLVRGSK